MVLEFDLYRLHEQLLQSWARSRKTGQTLHIFVSGLYADSAVSLKILGDVLKSECIQFSVFLVYGYDDILRHEGKGVGSNQPYTAVFINCGATEDIVSLLNAGPHARIFVVDCHRPIHLRNVRPGNQKVVVAASKDVDEDPLLLRMQETGDPLVQDDASEDEALSWDDELDISENGNSDDSDSDDSVSSGKDGPKRRRRERGGGGESPGSEDEGDRGEGGGPRRDHHRRRRRAQEVRERHRRRMQYYNRGSSFARPAGAIVFDMAHLVRKDTSEHLWLACVAITDHFIHCRLPPESYTAACVNLEQKVNSLRASVARKPQVRTEEGLEVKTPVFESITFDQELRVMCLQRWNLFDCIRKSTYPCTRLRTWTDSGVRRVKLMLAEMGIKHRDAKERWTNMKGVNLEKLKVLMEEYGPKHNMAEMCFQGFHLEHGYKTKVSAADVVYGVTALLESGEWGGKRETASDSFWEAAKALDVKGWKLLEEGMDVAIQVQGAIFQQGSLALVKKDAIRTTQGRNKFQYLILDDSADVTPLAHPLALTRLLHFFMDAQRELGRRPRPMMVAATPSGSTKSLVVGLPHRPVLGQLTGNKFGIAFGQAAERLGAAYRQEMFESSFLELEKSQLTAFVRLLSEVMNSEGGVPLNEGP